MTETKKARLSAQERRKKILMAAKPIFAEKGFAECTTREIAEAAGITEPILYRHFKSKKEIYDALIEIVIERKSYMAVVLTFFSPGVERLVAGLHFMARTILMYPYSEDGVNRRQETIEIARLFAYSLLDNGCFASGFVNAGVHSLMEDLASNIPVAKEQGHIFEYSDVGVAELRLAYKCMVGAAFFDLPEKRVVELDIDEKQVVRKGTIMLLRGLGVREEAIREFYPADYDELLYSKVLKHAPRSSM